jgi:hypothetical protein
MDQHSKLARSSIVIPTDRHTSQLRICVRTDRQIYKAMDRHSNKYARTSISVPIDRQMGHLRIFVATDRLSRLWISIPANKPEQL